MSSSKCHANVQYLTYTLSPSLPNSTHIFCSIHLWIGSFSLLHTNFFIFHFISFLKNSSFFFLFILLIYLNNSNLIVLFLVEKINLFLPFQSSYCSFGSNWLIPAICFRDVKIQRSWSIFSCSHTECCNTLHTYFFEFSLSMYN